MFDFIDNPVTQADREWAAGLTENNVGDWVIILDPELGAIFSTIDSVDDEFVYATHAYRRVDCKSVSIYNMKQLYLFPCDSQYTDDSKRYDELNQFQGEQFEKHCLSSLQMCKRVLDRSKATVIALLEKRSAGGYVSPGYLSVEEDGLKAAQDTYNRELRQYQFQYGEVL